MAPDAPALETKVSRLREILSQLEGGVLVAFSGGADSALLAAEAHAALGAGCVLFTADSPSLPRAELAHARAFAEHHGFRLEVRATREMEDPRYVANDALRCYHCKGALFETMAGVAGELGLKWILFGANADDEGDWRPGQKAAFERGGRAPLLEAGFTKADVRERSRQLGLETWDKPSAACLSSRFPTGMPITSQALSNVERAEEVLRSLGFRQCRVRLMGESARIEVEEPELDRFADAELRRRVADSLKALGFKFVTLDLEGFRSGSLNPRRQEV
jgi:uncharacterized protein